jgi:hypothetical protein
VVNDPVVDVSPVAIVVDGGPAMDAIRVSAVHAVEGYGEIFLAPAEERELLRVLTARANNEPEYP